MLVPLPIISVSMAFRLASSCSLTMSLNTWSICSRVRPLVSGTNKNVQTNESRQKTAKNVYAPKPVFWTSGGVIRPCDREHTTQEKEVEVGTR